MKFLLENFKISKFIFEDTELINVESIDDLQQVISDSIESVMLKFDSLEILKPFETLEGNEISVSLNDSKSRLILDCFFSLMGRKEIAVSIYPNLSIEDDENLRKELTNKLNFGQEDFKITNNLESEIENFISNNVNTNINLVKNLFTKRDFQNEIDQEYKEAFEAEGLKPFSKIKWRSKTGNIAIPFEIRVDKDGTLYDVFGELLLKSPGIQYLRIEYVTPPQRGLGIGTTLSGEYLAKFGDDVPLFLRAIAKKISQKINDLDKVY